MVTRVAIIGVGLIGSSLGLALQDIEDIQEVIGIDKNQDYLQQALDIGAIDRKADLEKGVKGVDLVIIATPVGVIENLIEKISPHLDPKTIITDVGSTKANLVGTIEQMVTDQVYIGGHPMTGSEISGPSGADKYLFENAIYVLTETESTDQKSLLALKGLIERLGAQVLILTPDHHDHVVAVTSHLPHIVAVNLMQVVAEFAQEDELITSLIAGGFRDTTRIAAGDPTMWRDIFLNNRQMVLNTIEAFEEKLTDLKRLILTSSKKELLDNLSQAKDSRIKLPMRKKGLLPSNYELILTLKDKPNAIGQVASLLGEAGINIQDIEVLKVRDEGGTLRVSFSQEKEQNIAYKLLKEQNYKVIKK